MAEIVVLVSIGRHPESGRPRRADLDARALELALQCAHDDGDARHAANGRAPSVSALHAGDPGEAALRDYLGMGLQRLTVLTGIGADAEAALSEYLRSKRPEVVLCGAAAETGESSGMLPYRVAEALGTSIVAHAVSISLNPDARTARVVQALPRGARRALRVPLPVVLTVGSAAHPARMSAYARARRGSIEVVRLDAVPQAEQQVCEKARWIERAARARPRRLRALDTASAAERLRLISAARTGIGARLDGSDPQAAARAIWRFLRERGLIG
jgi:electron transfer flavoprotein beta subunit